MQEESHHGRGVKIVQLRSHQGREARGGDCEPEKGEEIATSNLTKEERRRKKEGEEEGNHYAGEEVEIV